MLLILVFIIFSCIYTQYCYNELSSKAGLGNFSPGGPLSRRVWLHQTQWPSSTIVAQLCSEALQKEITCTHTHWVRRNTTCSTEPNVSVVKAHKYFFKICISSVNGYSQKFLGPFSNDNDRILLMRECVSSEGPKTTGIQQRDFSSFSESFDDVMHSR